MGGKPSVIGMGFDPKFHPEKELILYAGSRKVGDKTVDTDLRLTDIKGSAKWLTYSQASGERWPQWSKDGRKIIYSIGGTTDIYRLDFRL